MRRLSAVAVVLFLGAAVSLGGAVPAAAAVSVSVPAPDPKSFGFGAKKYMLNVTGKVLGSSMPTAWAREQISMNSTYNHSWDELARRTGINSAAPAGQLITEDWATKPQTKADYDLQRMEQGLKGGKAGKPFKAPASKPMKFAKSVAGVVLPFVAWEVSTLAGSKVPLDFLGIQDRTGIVCANTGDDLLGGIFRDISGADCNAWGLDPTYEPNQDVPSSYSWSNVCNDKSPQTCMTVSSYLAYRYTGYQLNGSGALYCVAVTGPTVSATYARPSVGTVKAQPGGLTTVPPPVAVSTVSGNIQCPAGSHQFTDVTYTKSNGANAGSTAVYPEFPDQMPAIDGIKLQKQDLSWTGLSSRTQTVGDPDRTIQCEIIGTDGLTYTADSASFKESSGNMAAPVCPVLPDGVAPAETTISEKADTANGIPGGELATVPSTPEYVEWFNEYPECREGACKLDLIQKSTDTTCFDNETACVGWFAAADKQSLYQCRYGVHDVALEECNVYSGVFKKERQTVGAPYSDPLSGEWSGGQSAPKPDRDAMGAPIQSPLVARGCDGMNVTGFDPVGFVMRPIQCALEWAFVPRPLPVEAAFVASSNEWKTTAPGIVGDTVAGWNLAAAPAGCGGMPVDLWGVQTTFLDACPGTTLAPVASASHLMSGLVFTIGGVLAIVAIVASVIGYRGITVAGGNH